MAKKKTRKKAPIDICPGCGGTRTTENKGSIELENGFYDGPWIVCEQCGLQGPRTIWDNMVKLRQVTYSTNGHSSAEEIRHTAYSAVIRVFGDKMLRELIANDPQKGDFLAWRPGADQAGSELEHHFVKLIAALPTGQRKAISEHCADLANIALAIDRHLGVQL